MALLTKKISEMWEQPLVWKTWCRQRCGKWILWQELYNDSSNELKIRGCT